MGCFDILHDDVLCGALFANVIGVIFINVIVVFVKIQHVTIICIEVIGIATIVIIISTKTNHITIPITTIKSALFLNHKITIITKTKTALTKLNFYDMILMSNRSGNRILIVFVVVLIWIVRVEVIVYMAVVIVKKLAVAASACDVRVKGVLVCEGVGGLLLKSGRGMAALGLLGGGVGWWLVLGWQWRLWLSGWFWWFQLLNSNFLTLLNLHCDIIPTNKLHMLLTVSVVVLLLLRRH